MQLTTDKKARKEQPIARGVLDYFGNAIAEVARVSFIGNQQHNPGEEMHWSRDKSADHADCVARHLIERGTIDDDGLRHSAKLAWRALALLQLEIEAAAKPTFFEELAKIDKVLVEANKQPADRNAEAVRQLNAGEFDPPTESSGYAAVASSRNEQMNGMLRAYGVEEKIARQIAAGTSFYRFREPNVYRHMVYIAGPMRGYPQYNFPAFDHARKMFLAYGYDVISPADIDRAAKDVGPNEKDLPPQHVFVRRDFFALYFLRVAIQPGHGYIAMLPGWEKSTGAVAEFFLARWLGLRVLDGRSGGTLDFTDIKWVDVIQTVREFLENQSKTEQA